MAGRPKNAKNELDDLIFTVDIPILKTLPKEGALIGQMKPLARNVKAIRGAINNALTVPEISGRIQILHNRGYVAMTRMLPVSQGKGYQITPKGEALVRELTTDREEN